MGRPHGRESFSDLQERAWSAFVNVMAAGNQNQRPAILTHAGVIHVLLCRILGMDLANLFTLELEYAGVRESTQMATASSSPG